MIVSYETLRTLTTYISNATIGLLLCDEGHRLKNSDSLTFKALNSLNVKRRVILSGTPIQVRRCPCVRARVLSSLSRTTCLSIFRCSTSRTRTSWAPRRTSRRTSNVRCFDAR